ncbi:MAG: glycosyltransferase family 2 protein [Puniceicoccales bacterium]|jgi:glycosyltransferase involved in cell wall biosynthesis|nr:glycosyltransferase family 2 protein [Puniceicoccales bacterium]
MSFTQPKVSILIPVHNSEPFLEAALCSAAAQTLQDIEIVCLDDGSTDGSLEILKKFAARDRRILVISQKNSGTFHARVAAAEAANGTHVLCLDADDWLAPDIAEKAYAVACDRGVDIVHFSSSIRHDCGESFRYDIWASPSIVGQVLRQPAMMQAILGHEISHQVTDKLVPRELFVAAARRLLPVVGKEKIIFRDDLLQCVACFYLAKSYVGIADTGLFYVRRKCSATVLEVEDRMERKIALGNFLTVAEGLLCFLEKDPQLVSQARELMIQLMANYVRRALSIFPKNADPEATG